MQHTTLDMSREQARLKPLAVAWSAPGKDWTFAEVETLTNRLAQGLRAIGLGRGDRVATLTHHQPECAILTLAAQKIGAVCMPVNWRLAAPEVEYILNDGQARFLMTDAEFLPMLATLKCPSLQITVLTTAPAGLGNAQAADAETAGLTGRMICTVGPAAIRTRTRVLLPHLQMPPCSSTPRAPLVCPKAWSCRAAHSPQPSSMA